MLELAVGSERLNSIGRPVEITPFRVTLEGDHQKPRSWSDQAIAPATKAEVARWAMTPVRSRTPTVGSTG